MYFLLYGRTNAEKCAGFRRSDDSLQLRTNGNSNDTLDIILITFIVGDQKKNIDEAKENQKGVYCSLGTASLKRTDCVIIATSRLLSFVMSIELSTTTRIKI